MIDVNRINVLKFLASKRGVVVVVVVELPRTPEDDLRSARSERERRTSQQQLVHARSLSCLWWVGWKQIWR